MNPWWLGLPAAEASIRCGDDLHRLRWEAGALRALDHEDPDGERALAALGGERCACVDLLDAWARHTDDLRVLVLASRGPGDVLAPQEDPSAGGFGGYAPMPPPRAGAHHISLVSASFAGGATPSPVPPTPESDLGSLLTLGGGLPGRLVATVAAEWRHRAALPDAEFARAGPRLQAALYGRALASLRPWLEQGDLSLELRMVDEGETASLRREDGIVHADLPFAWLVEVWSKGLATVWGRFCLDAKSDDGRRWTLTTVGPDLGDSAPLTLELSG